jgi:hypothetical protein
VVHPALQADLRGLLQDALRLIGRYVGHFRHVPALVGEGGHDAAHPPRGRQVEDPFHALG